MERNRVLYAYRNFSDRGLRLAMRETMRRVKSAMTSPAELWRMARGEDEARARLDAWRWLVANRALLREQRRFVAGDAQPFEDVVAAVLSRASYYDHARPQLAALVPEGAKVVVDVGCGGGALGRALKRERPELRVFGMEPTEQADRAAEWLDGVSRNRAELGLPAEFPRPDVVIFADVLEHLPEPLEVLKVWRGAMAPGATLIVSLPNVGHVSVVAPLLRGSWRYVDAGVLDRTHLRFFTRDTALELVREAGFRISYAGRVADLERGLVSDAWRERLIRWTDGIAAEGVDALRGRFADLWTMQFLLVGKNDGAS
jgi:2-polyprenyl-3-methyl-5-hydroxy-6-metoxy-1,4-benzoquinol methylase